MDVKLGFTVREECKLRISKNRLLRMHGPKWKLWEAEVCNERLNDSRRF
jgi:hypothetical protein